MISNYVTSLPTVHLTAGHNSHGQDHHHHHHQQQTLPYDKNPSAHSQQDTDSMSHHKMYMKMSTSFPFLVDSWSLQNIEGLLTALVVSTILSCLRDTLAYSLHTEEQLFNRERQSSSRCLCTQIRRTCMHVLSTLLAYISMLGVMTYNFWLLVTVLLGAGLSYFFLRPVIEWAYTNSSLTEVSEKTNNTFEMTDNQSRLKEKHGDFYSISEMTNQNFNQTTKPLLVGQDMDSIQTTEGSK